MSAGAVVLVLLGAGVVLAFVWFASKLLVALTNPNDRNRRPGAQVLRYHLVAGQDSPSVAESVQLAGYHATVEYDRGQVDLLVECSGDIAVEREKVRQAIADAPARDGGVRDFEIPPVRFADEPAADDPA